MKGSRFSSILLLFCSKILYGINRKQYVRMGKSHGILLKSLNVRVGSEKLGTDGKRETQLFKMRRFLADMYI